jgi:signal transduction histidine kinase
MGHLINNAIKFTPEGAVRIVVAVEEGSEMMQVHVRDTGVRISDDFRPYLVEPFRQESMGDQREFEGNGLNLSIAKRLVDLMGGRTDVESTKGIGTTFTAEMPLMEDPERFEAPVGSEPVP